MRDVISHVDHLDRMIGMTRVSGLVLFGSILFLALFLALGLFVVVLSGHEEVKG